MSKKKNYQQVRRQTRRVLNRMGDDWIGTISRMVYRSNYGQGLTRKVVGSQL